MPLFKHNSYSIKHWLLKVAYGRLALQLLTGPCTLYQYHLNGPGQWAGARESILTQWERVLQPFRTRVVPEPESRPSSRRSFIVNLSGAAILCCFFYIKHCLSSFFPPTFCKSKFKCLVFNQHGWTIRNLWRSYYLSPRKLKSSLFTPNI